MKNKKHTYGFTKANDGRYIILDESGKPINKESYTDVELFHSHRDDLHLFGEYPTDAPIDYIFAVKETANWNDLKTYYKLEFNEFLFFIYDFLTLLYFWLRVKFKKVERWKYITENGAPITKAVYDDATPFAGGVALAKVNGKWGVIDKAGTEIIPVKFSKVEYIFNFSDYGEMSNMAYIKVSDGKKQGICSMRGAILIPPIYASLRSLTWEAVSIITKNHSFSYGQLASPIQFENFKKIPLNNIIARLPHKHFFVSFDYQEREINFLFSESDNGFEKIILDEREYQFDFDFLTVSHQDGTLSLQTKCNNYEIRTDGILRNLKKDEY